RSTHQLGPHRIVQNVIRFLLCTLVMSQSVLEKVPLPLNAQRSSGPSFPIRNHTLNRSLRRRKTDQPVNMVRHDQKQIRKPQPAVLTECDTVQQGLRNLRFSQLVSVTHLAINRQVVNLLLRINPEGHAVGKMLSLWQVHGWERNKALIKAEVC